MSQQLKLNLAYLVRAMGSRERELRLGQSAASLSFISLLALVPLLTVVLATLTSFPIFAQIREAVQLVLLENLLPQGFANTIFRYLNQFVAKARTLSVLGVVFLMVTATVMMLTLDRTLNLIWRVEKPRPIEELLVELPKAGVCLVDHQQTSQLNPAIDVSTLHAHII